MPLRMHLLIRQSEHEPAITLIFCTKASLTFINPKELSLQKTLSFYGCHPQRCKDSSGFLYLSSKLLKWAPCFREPLFAPFPAEWLAVQQYLLLFGLLPTSKSSMVSFPFRMQVLPNHPCLSSLPLIIPALP